MQSNENSFLRCDQALVSPRGIFEMHGSKIIVHVPAAQIKSITLKFGRSDHRPLISLTIGIILSALGVFGITEIFLAPRAFRYELAMVALGAIGGSMIFDTLKKRYFLEVERGKDVARVVFSKQAQLKEIQEFCEQVRVNYKYSIEEKLEIG